MNASISAARIAVTVQLSAPDIDAFFELITNLAAHLQDADMVAAIRLDAAACCAEMDIAARPVDPRRLH